MDKQQYVKVIMLSDLWKIFRQRLWIILLTAIVAVTAVYAGITLTFVPRYKSVATLYILQQNNQAEKTNNYDDFSLALKVVKDCKYLMKSYSVLNSVIEELNLGISWSELSNNITIENPTDSRILEIRVEADSPENAKIIVDKICTIGTEKITEAMGFKQVNFYQEGILDRTPCNKTSVLDYAFVGLLAAVVAYAVFLMQHIFNDNINTEEDIEKYLNLSVLGDIPNAESTKKKGYGYGYGRKSTAGKAKEEGE